jgi:hypothetical protein
VDRAGDAALPGDNVKPIAKVDPPAYLYLFWIDEKGKAVPLYPWQIGKWNSRPKNEKPVAEVGVTWRKSVLKIEGEDAGTETVLMLARPTKLEIPDSEVKKWFTELDPVPFLGDNARVWFENFDVLCDDPDRRELGNVEELDGPRSFQADLRQRIGSQAVFSRAVSFSRRGAK